LEDYREPRVEAGIDTQTKEEAEKGCRRYEKVACPPILAEVHGNRMHAPFCNKTTLLAK
jgi:hypothetical protein